MSSQASSAGHGEKEVRKKIIDTDSVDVMISIRSGFFYTRSVPCELWHFDRSKSPERLGKVLMLDARNVHRKVTRKIYDFSPEQMQNLAAIIWLYRGQRERFLALVQSYLSRVCMESTGIPATLAPFEKTLDDLRDRFEALAGSVAEHDDLGAEKKQTVSAAVAELAEATTLYRADRQKLSESLAAFVARHAGAHPEDNEGQQAARNAFAPQAEAIRGLVKQVDLLHKLAARVADLGAELAVDEAISTSYDRTATGRLVKRIDGERKAAVEQLKRVVYFHRPGGLAPGPVPSGRTQGRARLGQARDPHRD